MTFSWADIISTTLSVGESNNIILMKHFALFKGKSRPNIMTPVMTFKDISFPIFYKRNFPFWVGDGFPWWVNQRMSRWEDVTPRISTQKTDMKDEDFSVQTGKYIFSTSRFCLPYDTPPCKLTAGTQNLPICLMKIIFQTSVVAFHVFFLFPKV